MVGHFVYLASNGLMKINNGNEEKSLDLRCMSIE